MIIIKINNIRYKQWKIKNDARKFKHSIKRKRIKKEKKRLNLAIHKPSPSFISKKQPKINKIVPENFSIIANPEETIEFFEDVFNEVTSNHNKGVNIFLDMKNVKNITVDALMYLIALIKSLREQSSTVYSIGGNLPLNDECRRLVKESGFLEHVKKTNIQTIHTNTKIRIRSGNKFESFVIRDIIDFIKEDGYSINTRTLYTVIGEIMNNSINHAYDEIEEFRQKWLLFVEKTTGKYKFTLLDTGLSIPYTVNRKIFTDAFKKDSVLLISALNGSEMRTQTKQIYRGKGLPEIKASVTSGFIDNMNIISRNAYCRLYDEVKIESRDLKKSLMGTLYYWEIIFNHEEEVRYDSY